MAVLAGVAALTGALAAVVWVRVATLPEYVVRADGTATITESGQQQFISADATFVLIGLVVGLLLGGLAWSWFKHVGWACAIIATGAGLLAGLVCWGVGELLGPGPFDARLAVAQPGDVVQVALQLRSPSALAVWAFASIAPTLFASSLGPEVGGTARPARAADASATMTDHGGSGATRAPG